MEKKLTSEILCRMEAWIRQAALRGVVCLSIAAVCAAGARAQQAPAEVYGPWSAVFLPDGPGLMEPAPGPWGGKSAMSAVPAAVLGGKARWTLAFWFESSEPVSGSGLTLLAGLGDPGAKDARFVGIVDGRLGLWLGSAQKRWAAGDSRIGEGWHFAVAAGD